MGDLEVLAEVARGCGMQTASKVLEDPEFRADEVRGEMSSFGQHVRGVPFFIIDNRFALSGAQESDAFLEVFQRL